MSALEVTWGKVGLSATFGAVIEAADVPHPQPKTTVVSIPGGVDLDLTDALTGHAAFERRAVKLTLFVPDRDKASELANLVNGVDSDFSLSWDPGYTYHGRASVTGRTEWLGQGVRLVVEIDASPWRLRQRHTTTVSASGGVTLTCRSGRRPVHPLINCDYPVTVNWKGRQFVVPAGQTYRMADVTFEQGDNQIWLSTFAWRTATWADLASSTWDDLSGIQWARVVVGDQDHGQGVPGDASVTLQWDEAYL